MSSEWEETDTQELLWTGYQLEANGRKGDRKLPSDVRLLKTYNNWMSPGRKRTPSLPTELNGEPLLPNAPQEARGLKKKKTPNIIDRVLFILIFEK